MSFAVVAQGELVVRLTFVRQYLLGSRATTGAGVLDDAFAGREVGAITLLSLLLALRGNRRTRRTVAVVFSEWRRLQRQGRGADAHPPALWYRAVERHIHGLFMQLRTFAYPYAPHHGPRSLTDRLARSVRRELAYTGAVRVELPTLSDRAQECVGALLEAMRGQQVVLWVDNWFCERYTTNPARPVLSSDVTAMGVLLLSSTADTPALGTRSHRFPAFPGHVPLLTMTIRVNHQSDGVRDALGSLLDKVRLLADTPLEGGWVRVPLDVRREQRRSLQWRALALSSDRVSAAAELLAVLEDVRAAQAHVGVDVPLLVDEKVHYSVCRLLYSQPFAGWDVAQWLGAVPLLYGVWHPYKHTLTLVYRAFFPVFALLGPGPGVHGAPAAQGAVHGEGVCSPAAGQPLPAGPRRCCHPADGGCRHPCPSLRAL
jgi:hypothetical protein